MISRLFDWGAEQYSSAGRNAFSFAVRCSPLLEANAPLNESPERRPMVTRYSFMLHLMIKTRSAVSTKPMPAEHAAPVGFALPDDENTVPAVPILLAELPMSALV